jgi:hypothetical protein
MSIHTAHHIYNITLGKKWFENILKIFILNCCPYHEPLKLGSYAGCICRNMTMGPNFEVTSNLMTLRVLGHRESQRNSTSRL